MSHIAMYTMLAAVHARVYPEKVPQGATMPFVVYHRISESTNRHQEGSCALAKASYQVSVVGSTLLEVAGLADDIREALDGQQSQVVAGVNVRRVSLTSQRDDATLFSGSQVATVETQMDFDLWFFQSETP